LDDDDLPLLAATDDLLFGATRLLTNPSFTTTFDEDIAILLLPLRLFIQMAASLSIYSFLFPLLLNTQKHGTPKKVKEET
jgi:hypothetical protein